MENFDEPYCKAREYMEGTAEEKHLLKTDCIKVKYPVRRKKWWY